ncbi:MAG: orotidine-5'-phosphate decarboxylase [Acidimicrobiales bacterium]|nr:orotidine-5'-phosphate decarboxylase [Acidimicrobiales bacterium]
MPDETIPETATDEAAVEGTDADTDTDTDEIAGEVRDRLALALDVDDLVAGTRLAKALAPYFGVAKIGLELYSAAGPDAIGALTGLGYDVFLDLKLHDIPNTVNKSSRVLGALGVSYLTYHAHGGVDMLKAGVEGLNEGASNAGLDAPDSLAVTVLTSDADAPDHIVPKRVAISLEAGCTGVVCAVADLQEVHHYAPRMLRVTPGIRMAGAQTHDQARAATPAEAIAGGSDLLVIGRAVTAADDPVEAAEQLVAEILS